MENETLKIFDEHGNQTGVATREEVHRIGYWHETFHCWFVSREKGIDYIYFQIRSDLKKDFPNLFDITVAGHILAHETVGDGIREVKEELGMDVSYDELVPLGVIKDCIIQEDFIDKELCNVFLYPYKKTINDYKLQKEEVSGIVKAEFNAFCELWSGEKEEIPVAGFELNQAGEKIPLHRMAGKNSFVSHENTYFETVIKLIKKTIE
ncbi:NUDIX hydrolase [Paenactinomyces guangxiensis]|uniref:NUDIX hydrolase n=1 Tax=Paenactinomyces guangxiensis TaxID=1490290 RepID=A0A7W2AAC1_9BACL|nr:NUDIX hydrolase [Paenactinomyces guangxiensis]MBA4496112.1 NUDIX hydrolase [Paenactinomyces guangxiensis]MBH8593200.1 NUDIX hydrolase [Paenactinomyces guangxiensis]